MRAACLRLHVFTPFLLSIAAASESQEANRFLVSVFYPLLLAIDRNCNEFGLSSLRSQ